MLYFHGLWRRQTYVPIGLELDGVVAKRLQPLLFWFEHSRADQSGFHPECFVGCARRVLVLFRAVRRNLSRDADTRPDYQLSRERLLYFVTHVSGASSPVSAIAEGTPVEVPPTDTRCGSGKAFVRRVEVVVGVRSMRSLRAAHAWCVACGGDALVLCIPRFPERLLVHFQPAALSRTPHPPAARGHRVRTLPLAKAGRAFTRIGAYSQQLLASMDRFSRD